MDSKKILVYFVSFLSLSLLFTAGYYFSYQKALEDFNRTAEERNKELLMSLEDKGLILVQDELADNTSNSLDNNKNTSKSNPGDNDIDPSFIDKGQAVDNIDEIIVLPTTKYILQTYNVVKDEKLEEELKVPSYLVGLNREEVVDYLDNYMKDLPWNEFKDGLSSYELLLFSDQEILIRKTYNPDLVEYQFYIKTIDDVIVVFYSDQKTVYDYTNLSTDRLSNEEKTELEEGYYIKDIDELYAVLENYTS